LKDDYFAEEPIDRKSELLRLRDEITKVSDELSSRVTCLGVDVLTARDDPDVRRVWNKLCRLHMKAMVSCEYDPINHEQVAKVCEELSRPRACVRLLQLSEEETCCARFLKRITM
jgi:hypothetical protein